MIRIISLDKNSVFRRIVRSMMWIIRLDTNPLFSLDINQCLRDELYLDDIHSYKTARDIARKIFFFRGFDIFVWSAAKR